MADTIKIGNLDISAFKVGSDDCKVYLGDTLLYPSTPPPTPEWITLNSGDTIPSGYVYGFKGESQIVGCPRYNILEIGTDSSNCVTFGHGAPTRAPQFTAYFYLVSSGTPSYIDSWEGGLGTFIFSDYASSGVSVYYNEDGTKTVPFDCQLYIAQI